MQRGGYYTLYLRGYGFRDEEEWLGKIREELYCPLDRWQSQPIYAEIWFEAAAMQGQFLYYANENIPLVAFKGDFTIGPKWETAERLAKAWQKYHRRMGIYYYGDYDPKGLIIPKSAWDDILLWAYSIVARDGRQEAKEFHENIHFVRVGINRDQIGGMKIPENPERPGTYQWEGLDDDQAKTLIGVSSSALDLNAFTDVEQEEEEIERRFRRKLEEGDGD